MLHGHHGGDSVSITWSDGNGQEHASSVTLVAGPANYGPAGAGGACPLESLLAPAPTRRRID